MCECEHAHHSTEEQSGAGHPYASVEAAYTIQTPYGTFRICRDCYVALHMGSA